MLVRLVCKTCGSIRRVLVDTAEQAEGQVYGHVGDCDGVFERAPNPPSTQMMEMLDNGAMPRALERLQNAEEMYREHAASDPRRKKV